MANNYCQSSSYLDVPPEKMGRVKEILDRAEIAAKKLAAEQYGIPEEWEDQCVSVDSEVDTGGVWFHSWEGFDPEHCELIARMLINELELDTPFHCSWAYVCDKMRVDEFGGGAFAIVRGKPTFWCDALHEVQKKVLGVEE